jgi:phosphoribosylformimino-5-aminoimidazole carboxamide ribotide isomerase
MLAGPNIAGLVRILEECRGISLIASGGVSCMADVRQLLEYRDAGLKGCILGKAIYDGRIDIAEALSLA